MDKQPKSVMHDYCDARPTVTFPSHLPSCITHRPLCTHQISLTSANFLWTDVQTYQPFFAGFTIMTDRLTDRPRYSICNKRLHRTTAVMRPNNNNNLTYKACIFNRNSKQKQLINLVSVSLLLPCVCIIP